MRMVRAAISNNDLRVLTHIGEVFGPRQEKVAPGVKKTRKGFDGGTSAAKSDTAHRAGLQLCIPCIAVNGFLLAGEPARL